MYSCIYALDIVYSLRKTKYRVFKENIKNSFLYLVRVLWYNEFISSWIFSWVKWKRSIEFYLDFSFACYCEVKQMWNFLLSLFNATHKSSLTFRQHLQKIVIHFKSTTKAGIQLYFHLSLSKHFNLSKMANYHIQTQKIPHW